jgi:tRNA A58 N-methylase Trm61
MGLSELFSNNLLVKWLRGDTGHYDLAVSMVGVKLGERLVQLGGRDGGLLAALGGKTGLTGQVVGVEQTEADATPVQQDAEKAGVLADAVAAPDWKTTFDPESFDLAVVPYGDPGSRDLHARVAEAFRLLRLGGRCTVIQRTSSDTTVALLQQHGFRAARLLAERDGLSFYEALKK